MAKSSQSRIAGYSLEAMLALYTRSFLSDINSYSRLLDEISERSLIDIEFRPPNPNPREADSMDAQADGCQVSCLVPFSPDQQIPR